MNTETLRKVCLSFQAVKEEIKWENNLVFSVGGKMFCITSFDELFKVSFKVPDEAFEELCSQEGFVPAPYLARARWVMVTQENRLTRKEWEQFLEQSYHLVRIKLTRKQKKELGISEE